MSTSIGDHDLRDEVTHGRYRRQEVGLRLDRRQRFSQGHVDVAEGGLEGGTTPKCSVSSVR